LVDGIAGEPMTREHPYVAAFVFAALAFWCVWRGIVTRRTMLFPWFAASADDNPNVFYLILTFFALFGLALVAVGIRAMLAAS
jgi:hypothetical protein